MNTTTTKPTVDIGLSEASRQAVSYKLNQLLADEHVLYLKTRNYHWNVRGMHFRSLHSFFEEQYSQLEERIDEIAERIRSLGHYAVGSLHQYLELTRMIETDHTGGDARGMLESLLNDHHTLIRILRRDLEEDMEQYNDAGTSDFLTGLMEDHEKMAWMIRTFLEE